MTIMSEKEAADKKEAVLQVFTLLAPKYKVLVTPRTLALHSEDQNLIIDDSNFPDRASYTNSSNARFVPS